MKILGTSRYSILQLKDAAKKLKLSFTLSMAPTLGVTAVKKSFGDKPVLQIVGKISSVRETRLPVLVTDSITAFSHANIPVYNPEDMCEVVTAALTARDIEVEVQSLDYMAYVSVAATASFMTEIQTAIYQITNPVLRKEVQANIIRFLDSRISGGVLKKLLQSNSRLEPIYALMNSAKAIALRSAVRRFRAGEDLAALELETKFTSFDIKYITRSAELTEARSLK